MSRPKQCRKMVSPPLMQGYKPFGIPATRLGSVTMKFDEYESIRLLDYKGLTQEQAAEMMNVSRPTLTRIYENARRVIAKAFVEGEMILIEGGNVSFDGDWFRCRRCYKLVDGVENHVRCEKCSHFSQDELRPVNVR